MHAHGALTDIKEDGSVFSGYTMQASKSTAALRIMDMQFKLASPAAASVQKKLTALASPVAQPSASDVYSEQWQVTDIPAPSMVRGAAALASPCGVIVDVSAKTSLILHKHLGSSQVLWKARNLPSTPELQLRTRHVQPEGLSGPCGVLNNPSCVAATGLIRVAIQEFPAGSFQQLNVGSNVSVDITQQTLAGHEGVLDQRAQLQPILLPCQQAASPVQPSGGISGVLITGGMGDIGSVLAAWAVEQYQGRQLWLLGRAGRGHLSAGLKHSNGCVTTFACNASSADDIDALHSSFDQVTLNIHTSRPYIHIACSTIALIQLTYICILCQAAIFYIVIASLIE